MPTESESFNSGFSTHNAWWKTDPMKAKPYRIRVFLLSRLARKNTFLKIAFGRMIKL